MSSGAVVPSTCRRRSKLQPEQDLEQQRRRPAAQACGRAAVGYGIGKGVSVREKPANTSGSWWSKYDEALSRRRTMRSASGQRP